MSRGYRIAQPFSIRLLEEGNNMKYKRMFEIDNNPVKLLVELDKRLEVNECRVSIYGHNGAVYFSWYDKEDAIKDIDKLLDELEKMKGKISV